MRPYFPLSHGVACVDDLRVLSGILYVIKHGLQWRDAPRKNHPPRQRFRLCRWQFRRRHIPTEIDPERPAAGRPFRLTAKLRFQRSYIDSQATLGGVNIPRKARQTARRCLPTTRGCPNRIFPTNCVAQTPLDSVVTRLQSRHYAI